MSRLYILHIDYELCVDADPAEMLSTDLRALMTVGADHHRAAAIKPRLRITDLAGRPGAAMDEWTTAWDAPSGADPADIEAVSAV